MWTRDILFFDISSNVKIYRTILVTARGRSPVMDVMAKTER